MSLLAALLPLLNRIDRNNKLLEKVLKALTKEPPIKPNGEPIEVITEPKLANRYKIITQTLTVALTDEKIGIKELKPTTGYCTYMNILAVGGGFTFKINSAGAETITAAVGMELEDYEIEEIFLTCGAVGGNAIFYLEYRVED